MDLHIEYISALTNLYGHVLPGKVCEVYNEHNAENLKPIEFEVYLTNPDQIVEDRFVYIQNDEFIVEELYFSNDRYEKLCKKQNGKPYYVPEKEGLLKYANLHYWEKPLEYYELEEHIVSVYFPNQAKVAEQLVEEVFQQISMDEFDQCIDVFARYEVIFEEDDKQSYAILYILQRLSNNTRMRAHNGFTPLELSKMTGEPIYILPVQELLEDDECHCGSKKKYKDCHLADDDKIRRLSDFRKES